MMLILCDEHKYLGGRMPLEDIIHYITIKPCPNCMIDSD